MNLVTTKKSPKKSSAVISSMISGWYDVNRSIDNLRKETEKPFSSFPAKYPFQK